MASTERVKIAISSFNLPFETVDKLMKDFFGGDQHIEIGYSQDQTECWSISAPRELTTRHALHASRDVFRWYPSTTSSVRWKALLSNVAPGEAPPMMPSAKVVAAYVTALSTFAEKAFGKDDFEACQEFAALICRSSSVMNLLHDKSSLSTVIFREPVAFYKALSSALSDLSWVLSKTRSQLLDFSSLAPFLERNIHLISSAIQSRLTIGLAQNHLKVLRDSPKGETRAKYPMALSMIYYQEIIDLIDLLPGAKNNDESIKIGQHLPLLHVRMLEDTESFERFIERLCNIIKPRFEFQIWDLVSRFSRQYYSPEDHIRPVSYDFERIATALLDVQPWDIQISFTSDRSWFNRLKGFVEQKTQHPWQWWPLKPYQRPLASEEAEISWECDCGMTQSLIAPMPFVEQLGTIIALNAAASFTGTFEPTRLTLGSFIFQNSTATAILGAVIPVYFPSFEVVSMSYWNFLFRLACLYGLWILGITVLILVAPTITAHTRMGRIPTAVLKLCSNVLYWQYIASSPTSSLQRYWAFTSILFSTKPETRTLAGMALGLILELLPFVVVDNFRSLQPLFQPYAFYASLIYFGVTLAIAPMQSHPSPSTATPSIPQSNQSGQPAGPTKPPPSVPPAFGSAHPLQASLQDSGPSTKFSAPLQQQRLFAFVMVRASDSYPVSEIKTRDTSQSAFIDMTSNEFFRILRSEYRRRIGRFRYAFSVWRFSHCDFYKLQKYAAKRYSPECADFPEATNTSYDFRPRDMKTKRPILEHEFYDRFHACSTSPSLFHWLTPFHNCTQFDPQDKKRLDLLPKRIFSLVPLGDDPDEFLGLYAREQPSFAYLLFYHMLLLAPALWFFFMWLFGWKHSGDLQNASVPITIALGGLSLFWAFFLTSVRVR